MADVIDVVHKITYEVDDNGLIRVQNILAKQLQDLVRLNNEILSLQKTSGKAAENQLTSIENAINKILKLQVKLSNRSSKSPLHDIVTGVLKGMGLSNTLEGAFEKFISSAGKVDKSGKIAAASITGLGDAALKVGKSRLGPLALSVGNVATKLFSFGNIATLVASLIFTFSDEIFGATENLEDYGEKIDEAAEFSKQLGESAGGEISKLALLKSTVEDTTIAYNKRIEAANELQRMYPQIFGNLKDEEILAGKVGSAYERVAQAIMAAAKASVFKKQLEKVFEELVTLQSDIETEADKTGYKLDRRIDKTTQLPVYNLQQAYYKSFDNTLKNSVQNQSDNPSGPNNVPLSVMQSNTPTREQKDADNVKEVSGKLLLLVSQQGAIVNKINILINSIAENSKFELNTSTQQEDIFSNKLPRKQSNKQIEQDKDNSYLSPRPAKELPAERVEFEPKEIDIEAMLAREEAAKAAARDKRKEEMKERIAEYKNFADEAIKAINAVYEAQMKVLDKEIELRKERVSQAEKLAERGNTEILRLEKEQLDKAQAEREKKARQQMQLNALLQASNQAVALSEAIGAIVSAAAKGDPYTIALRVAAAVAALVAGIASLNGAFSKANAYADGVVDFRGKGGPRDDANWVRISSGESVITAEGTRNNRHLLEAINDGAKLQFINPALAYTMPVFANPQYSTQGYASTYGLKVVETKLDGVINAIEDNRMKQNIFFNEHGVGIMTERAIRKDRKKWM